MEQSVATKENIIQYFDTCENAYRDFWDLDHSMLMSLGFWDASTKNLRQALERQNLSMAEKICLHRGHHVLDAGCGVGGSSIFLAKNYGCKVNGITLVPGQVNKAKENANRSGVAHLVSFQEIDFTKTPFPDGTFDVVWAIESICYAEPKSAFIQEAFRVLKPGGKLIVSETLAAKETMDREEQEILLDQSFRLCMVNSLHTAKQYLQELRNEGFGQVFIEDCTDLIRPAIGKLHLAYYPATLYNWTKNLFGRKFTPVQLGNTKMLYNLHKSLKMGLWKYGLIYAQKP